MSDNGILELCRQAYGTVSDRDLDENRLCWVMDLASYKRVRAECEAVAGRQTDPETWIPDQADMLFAIFIEVREGGGLPHLEQRKAA